MGRNKSLGIGNVNLDRGRSGKLIKIAGNSFIKILFGHLNYLRIHADSVKGLRGGP